MYELYFYITKHQHNGKLSDVIFPTLLSLAHKYKHKQHSQTQYDDFSHPFGLDICCVHKKEKKYVKLTNNAHLTRCKLGNENW